jgi:site-specific DNA recombinase
VIAKAPRPPVFFGYARVSTTGQAENGLSIEAQIEQIKLHYNMLNLKRAAKGEPPLLWGDVYIDSGFSAFKKHFCKRDAGGALNLRLQPGDHLVFSRLDRAFRRTRDAANMTDDWAKRGITVHYLDLNIDTSTAFGRFALTIMAGMAEFESGCKSERILMSNAVRRARGMCLGVAPIGMKRQGKYLVPDEHSRSVLGWIRWQKEVNKLGLDTIKGQLNRASCWTQSGKAWSGKSIDTAYPRAVELDVPYVTEMPTPLHKLTGRKTST